VAVPAAATPAGGARDTRRAVGGWARHPWQAHHLDVSASDINWIWIPLTAARHHCKAQQAAKVSTNCLKMLSQLHDLTLLHVVDYTETELVVPSSLRCLYTPMASLLSMLQPLQQLVQLQLRSSALTAISHLSSLTALTVILQEVSKCISSLRSLLRLSLHTSPIFTHAHIPNPHICPPHPPHLPRVCAGRVHG
jgi:hypothetical protein